MAGLPQIEREIVSQFAVSPVYARNELEIHLGMLCRVVVGMPGTAGQGLQGPIVVRQPEVDVETVLAAIAAVRLKPHFFAQAIGDWECAMPCGIYAL